MRDLCRVYFFDEFENSKITTVKTYVKHVLIEKIYTLIIL